MKAFLQHVLLAACAMVFAQAQAADVAAGTAKAEEVCADCHGDDGKGDDESPDIVKLTEKEFLQAMEEYRSGARTKNAKMARAAKRLTADEIANLAAYYETLK
ncbi:MAG: c-type cytochrome [Steroidobacteraceae bacterium]|nr:c-type cytochrome [Steroidobacteraceae bacterium]